MFLARPGQRLFVTNAIESNFRRFWPISAHFGPTFADLQAAVCRDAFKTQLDTCHNSRNTSVSFHNFRGKSQTFQLFCHFWWALTRLGQGVPNEVTPVEPAVKFFALKIYTSQPLVLLLLHTQF